MFRHSVSHWQWLTYIFQERKNALEEYIYDMRGKLDDRYASYVQPQEKAQLLAGLTDAEDWLYTEEGEEATKSVYVARLDSLKVIGDPIVFRYKEQDDRTKAISALRETLNRYMSEATSSDDKYSHIEEKDKQAIVEKCATVQKWLEDQIVRQTERAKNVDPVLLAADINSKRDEIIYFATPILTRPKPKPPKVDQPASGQQTSKPEGQGEPQPEGQQQPAQENGQDQGPPEMDVD